MTRNDAIRILNPDHKLKPGEDLFSVEEACRLAVKALSATYPIGTDEIEDVLRQDHYYLVKDFYPYGFELDVKQFVGFTGQCAKWRGKGFRAIPDYGKSWIAWSLDQLLGKNFEQSIEKELQLKNIEWKDKDEK